MDFLQTPGCYPEDVLSSLPEQTECATYSKFTDCYPTNGIQHASMRPDLPPELAPAHSPPAMPPRKKRKSGSQSRRSILDLPLSALALIYKHCDAAARKALLAVSRGCRNWVLREARSIKLILPYNSTTAARKPFTRLLNRACSLSACRLKLCLDFRQVGHQQSRRLLADLLEAGIQQSGWASVTQLVLQVRTAVKLSC
jgi:hypothetical protein